MYTHVNAEVAMQQHLELPALLALIRHPEHRLQRPLLASKRHTVYEPESIRPLLLRVLTQLSMREPEVELDTIVAAASQGSRLAR